MDWFLYDNGVRHERVKTGIISLLFLSLHVFIPLGFYNNYFRILLSIVLKPSDHNEIKPPIGKILSKNKPIRHYSRAHL